MTNPENPETFEDANVRRNRAAFALELGAFRDAARTLANRWAIIEDGDAVDHYPAWMPSFDEAEADIARMTMREDWTAERAAEILRATTCVRLSTHGGGLTDIGGGILAASVELDGEAWIWVSENLANGIGWQACLYLGQDHEGYYLPGPMPRTAEDLRRTVAALIVARDQAADAYEALFGLDEGTGVAFVLKEGGAVIGTLLHDQNDARRGWVTIARDGRQTRTFLLTDIRKVQVIG